MNEFGRLFSESGLSLERLRTFLAVAEAGNIAKAAEGDPTRQSQFSRQVKDLETYFGTPLTRRVGRRIEVTEEGHVLARMIRRQFSDLDDFREAMGGRPVAVRIGAAASVLEWMVLPKLADCRGALGEVILELEQQRTAEVVRGVADGRLDFGIVRDDAVSGGMKRWKLGRIGYGLFAPKVAWERAGRLEAVMNGHPSAELLPGGAFHRRYQEYLAEKNWKPQVVARVGSFLTLAGLVKAEGVAAVLPLTAAAEFDGTKIMVESLPWLHERSLVLVANARSIDRAGLQPGSTKDLAKLLAW
ncbi:MAG: LysR family transcriptional regulator, partial [Verrucomicrobiaceae bacterium]